MRITFTTVNRNVQRNLSRRYSDLVGLQEQLSTGKRLRKPSDDPVDVANTIKLRAKEAQLGQYKRNIQDGLALMGVAASSMASMNDLLHRARELAVQAANGTYNESDRKYMQQEVDQIYRQMMSVVNTQFKGSYIFNGTNGNVPPYKIVSSGVDRMDYENRTMATFGNFFEYTNPASYQPDVGLVTGTTAVSKDALTNTLVSHEDNGDTIYMEYASSHMRIGDKVQLKWNSVDPLINDNSLRYIYPETLPLDELYVSVTENGVSRIERFTNGINTFPIAGGLLAAGFEQLAFLPGGTAARHITPGTVKVTAAGYVDALVEGRDYRVDYETGVFTMLTNKYGTADLEVKFQTDNGRIDYEVDYVTGQISVLSEEFRDALNNVQRLGDKRTDTAIGARAGIPPTTGSVGYNDTVINGKANGLIYRSDNKFQIVEGKFGEAIRNIFPGSMKIQIGNKTYVEGHGEYQPDYYDQEGVLQKGKNKFDFEVDYETGLITVYNTDLLRDMRPDWLGGPDPKDPNSPPGMYKISQLQMSFDYITRGVDMYGDHVTSKGEIYRVLEEGIVVPVNIGADALLKDARSGNDMVGTLLRYSQALLKDDRDAIQSALDELTTMYDAVLNSQSQMGAKIFRFELTEQRNGEQTVEVGQQVSALADADLAEVISRLMLAESVYNAALQAAMRVLQPSLANYM